MEDIQTFLTRCDQFCVQSGMTQSALSKRLFKGDGGRLRLLKEGGDVGIRKFGDILQTLASLESDLVLKEGAS
jgi:hypothetical protein